LGEEPTFVPLHEARNVRAPRAQAPRLRNEAPSVGAGRGSGTARKRAAADGLGATLGRYWIARGRDGRRHWIKPTAGWSRRSG
jgi:hypothetical protein